MWLTTNASPTNDGALTFEMIEKAYEELCLIDVARPTVFIMSQSKYGEFWFMQALPTLYAAYRYQTPWERLISRCRKKMREMESYSSRSVAAHVESEY